jgi:DNA-binding response OmpR family regulator
MILVVDDDEDICANMADILADLGFVVDVANEGTTALELVRRRPYDVVLVDYKMPGMDGVTLCREIQQVRSGTVPLLITAYAGGDTTARALAAGAWQVLAKPVDFPTLMGLVNEAIGQPLVLIIDDDPDLCDTLRDVLREEGFRVCIAHDEAEAVERLRETTRVVLLDLRLPGVDGTAVFQRVHRANPTARVVLITGYPAEMEPMVGRLLDQGVDAVHYKPFDLPRLLKDLGYLVGASVNLPSEDHRGQFAP